MSVGRRLAPHTHAQPGRECASVRQGRLSPAVPAVLLVAALVFFLVALPLARLVRVAVEGGTSVGSADLVAAEHSLELAVFVALLAVPLGTAFAFLLRRPDVPCRRVLRALVLLPLLVPQFVLGYSWTQAYARSGFTDDLIGVHWSGLLGPAGIVVVLVVDAVPICYLLSSVGLATRAQPELELAARTSGASGWTAVRTVTLPLLRPVLAAEFVIVFVATLESFAAPQVLGLPAGYATLTTRLYGDLVLGSTPDAFRDAVLLALGLVLFAAVLLLPADLLLAPKLRTDRAGGIGRSDALPRRGGVVVALAAAGYGVLAVLLPAVALVAAATTRAIGLAPTPSNWTLENFRTALDGPTRDALWHSLQLAALAAIILTALGATVAGVERYRTGRALGTAALLSFALPGSALAVGLLIAYGNVLGGTLAIILIAYLAKFWALAHRTISAAVDRVPLGEVQAARVSGAAPVVAARTVWLPALAPALWAAALLVFVMALHEVTMSSLLYSTGTETFAVAVLNSQQLGATGTTAALSVTLTAVLVAVAAPACLLLRRRGSRVR